MTGFNYTHKTLPKYFGLAVMFILLITGETYAQQYGSNSIAISIDYNHYSYSNTDLYMNRNEYSITPSLKAGNLYLGMMIGKQFTQGGVQSDFSGIKGGLSVTKGKLGLNVGYSFKMDIFNNYTKHHAIFTEAEWALLDNIIFKYGINSGKSRLEVTNYNYPPDPVTFMYPTTKGWYASINQFLSLGYKF